MEIQGEFPPAGDAKGSIILDESRLTFNDWGNATPAGDRKALPLPVVFRQMQLEQRTEKGNSSPLLSEFRLRKGEDRRVYEVEFNDRSFPRQLRLVLSGATGGPHRLLIAPRTAPPAPASRDHLVAILDLHGEPGLPDPLGEAPLRAPFRLTTLVSAPPDQLHRIDVHGTPEGAATLDLDPNYLTFNAFGEVVWSTLIGTVPMKATLRRVEAPDPAGKGRRLFEVMPTERKLQERYFVVLSPTEGGPHRLLIRQGEALRQLLPLHDPQRRYHLAMLPELEAVSPPERQAIADLRQAIGYGLHFRVEAGTVVELSVSSGGGAEAIDPSLKQLRNLRRLGLSWVSLGATGLPNLRALPRLEHLRFDHAQINDAGLASIGALTQLRGLWFYNCSGITDQGVAHLGGLKKLKILELSRENSLHKPELPEARITDAGLVHLQRLNELESLNLSGQRISAPGLKRLKSLSRLTELYLSGKGITDAGLQHLAGLRQLRKLHRYQTRVTPAGSKALKAKLPLLSTP
jgi:hypothetical protein